MSRGLGRIQTAFVLAMQSLDREHGPCYHRLDVVAAHAVSISDDLTSKAQCAESERAEAAANLYAAAEAGDRYSREVLKIQILLRRRHRGGWYRSKVPNDLKLNPSRVVRLLEKRGLAQRSFERGFVALTEVGRSFKCTVNLPQNNTV